jgi:hypothetical protein
MSVFTMDFGVGCHCREKKNILFTPETMTCLYKCKYSRTWAEKLIEQKPTFIQCVGLIQYKDTVGKHSECTRQL